MCEMTPLMLGSEIMLEPEKMFDPEFGFVAAAVRSLGLCGSDAVRDELRTKIVISGGGANIKKFGARFASELSSALGQPAKVLHTCPPREAVRNGARLWLEDLRTLDLRNLSHSRRYLSDLGVEVVTRDDWLASCVGDE